MLSITEVFRLSTSYLVINILGLKIKANKDSFIYNIFYPLKQNSNQGKNNKLIFVENNKEKSVKINKRYEGFSVNFLGNNNTLIIDKNHKLIKSNFIFNCSNSLIKIGFNTEGKFHISAQGNNCSAIINDNTYSVDTSIFLVDNSIEIGKNCLFSNNLRIISDAHSVLDANSKKVLNLAEKAIKIGDNVWIGEKVFLTKNAQIPDNCIVGISSVVTKSFDEKNSIIAGNPAKIVKKNIIWDKLSPRLYSLKEYENENR